MNNITVIKRTLLGFSIVTILIVFIGLIGYWAANQLKAQIRYQIEVIAPLTHQVEQMAPALERANIQLYLHILSTDAEQREATAAKFNELASILSSNRASVVTLAPANIRQQLVKLNEPIDLLQADYMLLAEEIIAIDSALPELVQTQRVNFGLFDEKWQIYSSELTSILGRETRPAVARAVKSMEIRSQSFLPELREIFRTSTLEEFADSTANATKIIEQMESAITRLAKADATLAKELQAIIDAGRSELSQPESSVNLHLSYLQKNARLAELQQLLLQMTGELNSSIINLLTPVDHYIQQLTQESEQTYQTSMQAIAVTIVVSLFISLLISFTTVMSIRQPMQKLMDAILQLAAGDLRVRIENKGNNEFAKIGRLINQLTEQLAESIGGIAGAAVRLQQNAQQSLEISANTQSRIAVQTDKTHLIATAIQQMEEAVREVSSATEQTSLEVDEVNQAAQQNRANMTANINAINELDNQLVQAGKTISDVEKQSDQISKILEVIQGIADQTNLLALNAAIESARAGEMGRGFAVVADEVRSLATKTRNSTTEINEMIQRLQVAAEQAVVIMQASQQQAKTCVSQSSETGDSLERMSSQLQEITVKSRQVAQEAQQQSHVAHEVTDDIKQISELAQQTSDGAQASATSSEQVNSLANEQSELVARFKY